MAKQSIFSPWFHPDTKPTQPGVYELGASAGEGEIYSRWTGENWCYPAASSAEAEKTDAGYVRVRSWRGLSQDFDTYPNRREGFAAKLLELHAANPKWSYTKLLAGAKIALSSKRDVKAEIKKLVTPTTSVQQTSVQQAIVQQAVLNPLGNWPVVAPPPPQPADDDL